jgi:hypothetical protein
VCVCVCACVCDDDDDDDDDLVTLTFLLSTNRHLDRWQQSNQSTLNGPTICVRPKTTQINDIIVIDLNRRRYVVVL